MRIRNKEETEQDHFIKKEVSKLKIQNERKTPHKEIELQNKNAQE